MLKKEKMGARRITHLCVFYACHVLRLNELGQQYLRQLMRIPHLVLFEVKLSADAYLEMPMETQVGSGKVMENEVILVKEALFEQSSILYLNLIQVSEQKGELRVRASVPMKSPASQRAESSVVVG